MSRRERDSGWGGRNRGGGRGEPPLPALDSYNPPPYNPRRDRSRSRSRERRRRRTITPPPRRRSLPPQPREPQPPSPNVPPPPTSPRLSERRGSVQSISTQREPDPPPPSSTTTSSAVREREAPRPLAGPRRHRDMETIKTLTLRLGGHIASFAAAQQTFDETSRMAERGKGLLEEITQHGLVGSSAHTTANTLYTDAEERRVSAEKNRLEKQAELMNVVTEMMSIFAGVLPPPAPGTTSIFLPPLDPPKLEVSVPDHSAEIWALREELNELKGVLHSHLGLVKEQTEDIKKLEAKLDEARQSAELQVAEARDAFQKQLEEAKAEVTAEFEKVGSRISFGWDVHDKRFLETCQKALVRDTRIAELESQWSKALGMKSELDELQQKVPVLSEHVGTALKHSQMVDKKVKENVDAVNTTIEEIKMDIQREQSEGAGRGFRLNAITADIQRLQDDIKPISQAQTASESRMKTLEERYDAHLVIVSGLQDQFNQLIAESKKRKRDEDDEGEDESVEGPGGPTPISRKARFKRIEQAFLEIHKDNELLKTRQDGVNAVLGALFQEWGMVQKYTRESRDAFKQELRDIGVLAERVDAIEAAVVDPNRILNRRSAGR